MIKSRPTLQIYPKLSLFLTLATVSMKYALLSPLARELGLNPSGIQFCTDD